MKFTTITGKFVRDETFSDALTGLAGPCLTLLVQPLDGNWFDEEEVDLKLRLKERQIGWNAGSLLQRTFKMVIPADVLKDFGIEDERLFFSFAHEVTVDEALQTSTSFFVYKIRRAGETKRAVAALPVATPQAATSSSGFGSTSGFNFRQR